MDSLELASDAELARSAAFWRGVLDVARIVIVSLILAFVFRAFFVEPFIIPTGSMAHSLLGDHSTFVCPHCGGESDIGASAWRRSEHSTICAQCRRWISPAAAPRVKKAGDRILVHKWPIDLAPPQRWEVIVFRDPENPSQTYIKRLVGLPGESIEFLDGDVWINGAPAIKPPHVQEVLWQPVFEQARVARAVDTLEDDAFRWVRADSDSASCWLGLDERVLRFDPAPERGTEIALLGTGADSWLDFTGYNEASAGNVVRDLRLAMTLVWDGPGSACEVQLSSGDAQIIAAVSASGEARHAFAIGSNRKEGTQIAKPRRSIAIELTRLDGRSSIAVDGRTIAQCDHRDLRDVSLENSVVLRGHDGPFRVRDFRLARDVYYTTSRRSKRAVRGEPFSLQRDEYFVAGDNSADSHDSREWESGELHLPADYRPGTVRGGQIVGRAAMVYLPGWLSVGPRGYLPVPDLGRVRFIR